MDLSAFIFNGVPTVAIFLLFFASVALIFEIFFFRKKKSPTANIPLSTSAAVDAALPPHPPSHPAALFKGKNLIIIGVLVILFILPISLYVALQQVNVEQLASPQTQITPTTPQSEVVCNQVDILRNNSLVDPSQLSLGDTVTFVGYCYVQSVGNATQTIYTLHFELTAPTGQTLSFVQLAFPATEKDSSNRHFFRTSYPLVKLAGSGSYTVRVRAFDNNNTELTKTPFVKSFTIGSSGGGTQQLPTPTPTTAQASAVRLTCSGLSQIPLSGPAPLTVSFTGSGSDTGTQGINFEFTFGDGALQTVSKTAGQTSATISHVYNQPGSYTASLVLSDTSGSRSSVSAACTTQITVTAGTGQSATVGSNLKAQPAKGGVTPTTVQLPQAGMDLPLVGFTGLGLLLLTAGLLLAF